MATTLDKGSKAKEILQRIRKTRQKATKNLESMAGKLKSDIDPIEFQKKARDEWR